MVDTFTHPFKTSILNGFTVQGGKINVNQPEKLELLTIITMVVLLDVMHHTALPMTTGHLANSMGTESRTLQVGCHWGIGKS